MFVSQWIWVKCFINWAPTDTGCGVGLPVPNPWIWRKSHHHNYHEISDKGATPWPTCHIFKRSCFKISFRKLLGGGRCWFHPFVLLQNSQYPQKNVSKSVLDRYGVSLSCWKSWPAFTIHTNRNSHGYGNLRSTWIRNWYIVHCWYISHFRDKCIRHGCMCVWSNGIGMCY